MSVEWIAGLIAYALLGALMAFIAWRVDDSKEPSPLGCYLLALFGSSA